MLISAQRGNVPIAISWASQGIEIFNVQEFICVLDVLEVLVGLGSQLSIETQSLQVCV